MLILLAILVATRATLAALLAANQDLETLREAEMERAALEERARLARELHDGLAQELWLAKLKAGRLATIKGPGSEAGS